MKHSRSLFFGKTFIFLSFFAFLIYLGQDFLSTDEPPFPQKSLELAIYNDLSKLNKDRLLPNKLLDLKSISVLDHRQVKKPIKWAQVVKYYFLKKQNGNFDLEIEVFDTGPKESPSEPIIIVQYSLFESSSKNKIWEMSRSF